MDDIRIDDDPRKQSAKKIKKMASEEKGRGFGGFLFDWIIKSYWYVQSWRQISLCLPMPEVIAYLQTMAISP